MIIQLYFKRKREGNCITSKLELAVPSDMGRCDFRFFFGMNQMLIIWPYFKRKSNSRSMHEKTIFSWMFVAPFPRGNPGVREFPAGETSQVREGSLNTQSRKWTFHINGEKLSNNFIFFYPNGNTFDSMAIF